MSWTRAPWRRARWPRCLATLTVLLASALLSSGCGPSRLVIPDERIPHQVAKETTAVVWMRLPDGEMAQVEVRVLVGWWLAGPLVVEGGK